MFLSRMQAFDTTHFFTKKVPTTEARPITALANSSPGMTAAAMINLNVLDADGRAVRMNVFVNEGSDSTLFREGFIQRLRLVGECQTLAVDWAVAVKNKYLSRREQLKLKLPCNDIVAVVGSTMPIEASGRRGRKAFPLGAMSFI